MNRHQLGGSISVISHRLKKNMISGYTLKAIQRLSKKF